MNIYDLKNVNIFSSYFLNYIKLVLFKIVPFLDFVVF